MRTVFSKVLILSLFIILLAFVYKDAAFAEYTITSTKDYEPTSLSPTPSPSTSSPKIDENTKTITITFSGLVSDEEYFLCLRADSPTSCLENSLVSVGKPDGNGDLTRNFCADSRDTLKLSKGDGKEECSEDDYFWAGHTYSVALIRKDPTRVVDKVPIYVSHYFPRITVSPDKPSNEDGEGIKVNIEGTRRKHDNENRNNYAVELHDQFGKRSVSCDTVGLNSSTDFILPTAEVGDYLIKINEQVNEGKIVGNDCSAGYTYYTLGVRIRKGGGSFDKNPDGSLALKPDPNGTDLQGNEETFPTPPLPCLTLSQEGGGCDTVETAIGAINTNATGFIKSIFSLILGLSGGIALLLIISSGYRLMAARGNPEALTEARDQLISAIIGLLFIIFSLVILQIIGVDILKIPGFGN